MTCSSDCFIRRPSSDPFQPEFIPLLSAVPETLRQILNSNLHSVYVYGSVAETCALPEHSDLDICVILFQPLSAVEQAQLKATVSRLTQKHDVVRKIDVDMGTLNEVLAPQNLFSWGYWLRHHCRPLYGADLSAGFADFTPSKEIALAVNGDYESVFLDYLKRIEAAKCAVELFALKKSAAKKLIRSTNILRECEDRDWPYSLQDHVDKFVAVYPQHRELMDYFLKQSNLPCDEKKVFTARLVWFITWLNETAKKCESSS